MRDNVCRIAFAIWLIGLVVSLASMPFNSAVIEVAFPVSMAGGLVLVVACYGVRGVLTRLVPIFAALALLGWASRAVHVPDSVWLAVLPAIVVIALRRFDRGPGAGPRWQ